MATPFEIVIAGAEAEYARQAAGAVFDRIDRFERLLSRFDPCSEIGQINRLGPGESVRVDLDVLDCLLIANEVHCDTGGAFDVTVGPAMRCIRDDQGHPKTPEPQEIDAAFARVGMNRLILNGQEPSVGVVSRRAGNAGRWPGCVEVDLGGIGKGFALDRTVEILDDWGIGNVLIHGGTSTALVMGSGGEAGGCPPGTEGWAVGVGGPWGHAAGLEKIILRRGALSGSGFEAKGRHILDPRTGRPARGHLGAWVVCPTAAVADALSTAFVVMTTDEVRAYCEAHEDVSAFVVAADPGARDAAAGRLISIGRARGADGSPLWRR